MATDTDRVVSEEVCTFEGDQGSLLGIFARHSTDLRAAVLIVAGQPQTRVGSHRMFTDLARGLAASGVASLRFDVGGWGDSPGEPGPFEASDIDVTAAARELRRRAGADVPLWIVGLCDGASAATLALPRLGAAGLVPDVLCLLNPWVRSEASLAKAMVRTYYAKRLLDPEFWKRLLSGRIPWRNLVAEPLRVVLRQFSPASPSDVAEADASGAVRPAPPATHAGHDLPTQLLGALTAYRGEVLTVLSGSDLTAGETEALMSSDRRWRKRLERNGRLLRVAGADHTFSDPAHWNAVCDWLAGHARKG